MSSKQTPLNRTVRRNRNAPHPKPQHKRKELPRNHMGVVETTKDTLKGNPNHWGVVEKEATSRPEEHNSNQSMHLCKVSMETIWAQ
eukprot:841792-Amphidinium_carterae.2